MVMYISSENKSKIDILSVRKSQWSLVMYSQRDIYQDGSASTQVTFGKVCDMVLYKEETKVQKKHD